MQKSRFEILSLNLSSSTTTCSLSFCYAAVRVRCKFIESRGLYDKSNFLVRICTIEVAAQEKAYRYYYAYCRNWFQQETLTGSNSRKNGLKKHFRGFG